MIDFYIILIQWPDVLLERGVMDLDVRDWTLITGEKGGRVVSQRTALTHKNRHARTHTHTYCDTVGVCARARVDSTRGSFAEKFQ